MRWGLVGIVGGLLIGFAGCAVVSPREARTSLVCRFGDAVTSVSRSGPAPIWVQDRLETTLRIRDGETSVTITASYDPNAAESAGLWGKIFSGLFGFLAGLFAAG